MNTRTRSWEKIRSRLKALHAATDWPEESERIETPEQRAVREDMEHTANWGRIAKGHELIAKYGGTVQMQKAIELVALKATYELALLTGALSNGKLLGSVNLSPGQSLSWLTPIKDPRLPANFTLNPQHCPRAVFQEALAAVEREVAPDAHSQQGMLLDYLATHLDAWPTPLDLLTLEGEIVEDGCRMLGRTTRTKVFDHFVATFDFSPKLAKHLMNLCEAPLRALGKVDKQLERGLILARTESFYRRARQQHDLKAEGTALKIHLVAAGLTTPDPNADRDGKDDWVDVITRVNSQESKGPAPKLLSTHGPGRDVIVPNNPEPEDDEESDDA